MFRQTNLYNQKNPGGLAKLYQTTMNGLGILLYHLRKMGGRLTHGLISKVT